MTADILYLSHARVEATTFVPVEELAERLRSLAQSFPLTVSRDSTQAVKAMLVAMPAGRELYWHGKDGKACPCASCCGTGYRRLTSEIEAHLSRSHRMRPSKHAEALA